ncbi:hypothetical protein NPIL_274801 [Nephila pilipes]|uniref:Uncharacterized protein n=1 Tax=Nephila pilipes TaxID=299642 RepID=A0A8X6U982_NEPPI|nr:hypothetical protein NPIL_274801 [Nephila pilipes]
MLFSTLVLCSVLTLQGFRHPGSKVKKARKRPFSELDISVSPEGIFDSESNQNLVEAIVCQNSDSVMSGMFDRVNGSSVTERDFVMCSDNSNPNSVMSDIVHSTNDFSVAESDIVMCDNSNPNYVMSDIVHSTNDKSVDESDFVCLDNVLFTY